MKVKVRLIQKDLIDHTTNVIVDTVGLLKGSQLSYFEEDRSYKHTVVFEQDTITITRSGEFSSETSLIWGKNGKSKVRSPYGLMELSTKLCTFNKSDNRWIVNYQLLSGTEILSHMEMTWEIRHFA